MHRGQKGDYSADEITHTAVASTERRFILNDLIPGMKYNLSVQLVPIFFKRERTSSFRRKTSRERHKPAPRLRLKTEVLQIRLGSISEKFLNNLNRSKNQMGSRSLLLCENIETTRRLIR